MNLFKKYYNRINCIKASVAGLFVSALLMPGAGIFQDTGDNLFQIYLNDEWMGQTADMETAQECLRNARRVLSVERGDMVLTEAVLKCEGSKVLFGEVTDKYMLVDHMVNALAKNEKETLHKAYTVKVNEYTVNLASIEDVKALLQAALDRFHEDSVYTVNLHLDGEREFSVLTAEATSTEEVDEKIEQLEPVYFGNVGVYAQLEKHFQSFEPEMEKDFEDYDLGLISMNFSDKIEVVEAYLPDFEIASLEDAITEVTKDQEKEEIYEVVAGDTLSQIAEKVQIPMDNLIALNETLENENSTIRVGDELIITVPQPELSVDRQEELYYEEDYEADIIYVDNDEWYTTQTKTLQEPSAGHRKVVAIVSYHNNEKVSTEILKQEITYQAVPKIVERGTKIPPTYIKPISGGRLSSQFGRRNRPTKGASSYHKGVDWAIPVGTAVMASSGGVVTRAGWGRGYGYVVYIRHADGRETRYGHLSKILVSAGQSVSQGQKIALSGNTGVSTGPHLHFEILINGSQVDPFKYMN